MLIFLLGLFLSLCLYWVITQSHLLFYYPLDCIYFFVLIVNDKYCSLKADVKYTKQGKNIIIESLK